MKETVEIVTTRTYTVGDIKKILAPDIRGLDVTITTIAHRGPNEKSQSISHVDDMEVLKVTIREPYKKNG